MILNRKSYKKNSWNMEVFLRLRVDGVLRCIIAPGPIGRALQR